MNIAHNNHIDMKNKDIITLANGGFLVATGHSLPVEHFYKFHKFRRDVEKANSALGAQQADMLRDCGIDPSKMSEASSDALARFNAANDDLLDEEALVSVKARIPFECYKGIYDENRRTLNGQPVDIFADINVENVVLDNLFTEPENQEEENHD